MAASPRDDPPRSLLIRAVRPVHIAHRSIVPRNVRDLGGSEPHDLGRCGGGGGDEPVDLLVERGYVVAAGDRLAAPPGTRVVEGDGRWVIPGLWDHHVHMTQWAHTSARLDVSGTTGPRGVLDIVDAELRSAATVSRGTATVGYGYRSGGWPTPTSTAALDGVAGERVVVLVSGDGHNGWLSSAAQRFFGVAQREGAFEEGDWFPLWARLGELPGAADEGARGLRVAVADAASRGVVGIVDMELGTTPEEWVTRVEDGLDALRVRVAVYREHLDAAIARGLRTGDHAPGGQGLVTMGPFKIITDGSLATRTAHCHTPYPARSRGHRDGDDHPTPALGRQNVDGEELAALLSRARRHGLTAAVHTIGDAAADIALDAIATSRIRASIEHAQLMTVESIARMAQLDVRASVQPAHLIDDRDLTEVIWPGRAERCFMFRSMLDAGVELALGSDAPVARLDPWLAMAAAVHRTGDEREPWVPGEQITATEALSASVDGAPTVAVGSRADLALLESDPLVGDAPEGHAAQLRTMGVATTVVGGRVTHDSR